MAAAPMKERGARLGRATRTIAQTSASRRPPALLGKVSCSMERSQATFGLAVAGCVGAAVGALISTYRSRPRAPYDASLDEVSALVRPNIRRLEPYRCARDDYEEGVLLDANENAFGPVVQTCPGGGPRGAVVRAACGLDLHRYPCPYQKDVKDAVARFRGVALSHPIAHVMESARAPRGAEARRMFLNTVFRFLRLSFEFKGALSRKLHQSGSTLIDS